MNNQTFSKLPFDKNFQIFDYTLDSMSNKSTYCINTNITEIYQNNQYSDDNFSNRYNTKTTNLNVIDANNIKTRSNYTNIESPLKQKFIDNKSNTISNTKSNTKSKTLSIDLSKSTSNSTNSSKSSNSSNSSKSSNSSNSSNSPNSLKISIAPKSTIIQKAQKSTITSKASTVLNNTNKEIKKNVKKLQKQLDKLNK